MRKIFSVIVVILLCASLTVAASAKSLTAVLGTSGDEFGLLVDNANLLTDAEEAALRNRLAQLTETYQAEVIVITMLSLQGENADYVVETLYDQLQYGCGPDRDGVMLMVSMDEWEYRNLSNGFASDAIGPDEIEDIGEVVAAKLSDGEYAKAFNKFADGCEYYLDGHINGFPFNFGGNLLIALVIGLIVGVIVAFVLKGQLKTVRKKYRANDYVKAGSMKLTVAHDLYLYRNVRRTQRQSSSSGSGSRSGSSRSVGGGKF